MKTVVKGCGATVKLQVIKGDMSTVEGDGIRGVEVKSVEITKNTDGEGSLLNRH